MRPREASPINYSLVRLALTSTWFSPQANLACLVPRPNAGPLGQLSHRPVDRSLVQPDPAQQTHLVPCRLRLPVQPCAPPHALLHSVCVCVEAARLGQRAAAGRSARLLRPIRAYWSVLRRFPQLGQRRLPPHIGRICTDDQGQYASCDAACELRARSGAAVVAALRLHPDRVKWHRHCLCSAGPPVGAGRATAARCDRLRGGSAVPNQLAAHVARPQTLARRLGPPHLTRLRSMPAPRVGSARGATTTGPRLCTVGPRRCGHLR